MRVLVVDDSAFMRRIITDLVNSDPEMNVVGTAFDGVDAIEKISQLHPDIVTLDITMPRMDGLTTLKRIMEEHPLPIIMLSSVTQEGTETTFKALKYGAIDYVAKPSGQVSLDIGKIKDELISKIKTAMLAKIIKHQQTTCTPIQHMRQLKDKVILIGASTGGPPAIEDILLKLPEDIPPILIVQHMPSGFTKPFAERLSKMCKFEVKEAEEDDQIVPSKALIAPGGYHMTVGDDEKVHLNMSPQINFVRPAVDPLMETAASVFQSATVGVLLTGMGKDGAFGMKAIKKCGGMTVVQDEATCTVFGMPKAAIEEGCADKILPLSQIPQEIIRMCQT